MMGCFEELRIPWMESSDLGDPDVGGDHLAENFRFIDKWANPLTADDDCLAACPPVARGKGTFNGGTVAMTTNQIIEDSLVGTVDVDGDMTWDGTAGGFLVPREGFYHASMTMTIDCTPVTDPYWIGLTVVSESSLQLPPFNIDVSFVQSILVYLTVGQQIQFRINNDETATTDLDFGPVSIAAAEVPCSSIA